MEVPSELFKGESPEDKIVELENFRTLADKAFDKTLMLEKMFFNEGDFQFWTDRYVFRTTIRKMAMTYHMSRYNIRKKLKRIDNTITALRKLLATSWK